ncbi:hypothetical protein KI387_044573, partial [Taxus chinensis]
HAFIPLSALCIRRLLLPALNHECLLALHQMLQQMNCYNVFWTVDSPKSCCT